MKTGEDDAKSFEDAAQKNSGYTNLRPAPVLKRTYSTGVFL